MVISPTLHTVRTKKRVYLRESQRLELEMENKTSLDLLRNKIDLKETENSIKGSDLIRTDDIYAKKSLLMRKEVPSYIKK